MRLLGRAEFGAVTFCASSYGSEQCGANGLPLTPHSIRILGRFQRMKTLEHPRLCKYLDLVRCKHERLIVVSEYYSNNLQKRITWKQPFKQASEVVKLVYDVVTGLAFLNSIGLIHRSLSPSCLLFDEKDEVKLFNYGLYYMTANGVDISFPVETPKYMSPEIACHGFHRKQRSQKSQADGATDRLPVEVGGAKTDVWSLGIILTEVVLGHLIWEMLSLSGIMQRILEFVHNEKIHPFDSIVAENNGETRISMFPSELIQLIRDCLTVTPSNRPLPSELLSYSMFNELRTEMPSELNGQSLSIFSTTMRCKNLEITTFDEKRVDQKDDIEGDDLLAERSLEEVYYLWKLAGGDLEGSLQRAGLIRTNPPITKLSRFVLDDGEIFGEVRSTSMLFDNQVVVLSQEQLRQRLSKIAATAYYPLLEDENGLNMSNGSTGGLLSSSSSSSDLQDSVKLPLVIRERDVEYQFHRIILFERLLAAYPYKRLHILKECRIDIPPLLRAKLWPAILEIDGDVQGRYEAIDKESPILADRQIEVDIPRCHQYNELLSSPTGHWKFKRILKAWVVSHPEYVYWQGLDSLCAPFLYLNFNDEALAFSCLSAFIPKYLHRFFQKDNTSVIQEYLAVFSHLISFHDPQLCNHLDAIGFIPDLYSIPWFLTMYAHVFPLDKIFHLWDTLLLGNSSFPLCIGVAILQQLRDQLLSFGFNECILLFSDMPEIDIERCVQDSIKIFCTTPKSATYRQHALTTPKTLNKNQSKPVISYYSQDYHETPKTNLSMEPIPVEELKTEKFPRISAEDLIELSELHGPMSGLSPTKRSKSAKPILVVVDVRPEDDFRRGSFPGSVNVPFHSAFSPEGDLNPSPAVHYLNQNKTPIKVVIGGSRGKHASHFADALIRLGYVKVCVLHKGIDVLRNANVLSIPPVDF